MGNRRQRRATACPSLRQIRRTQALGELEVEEEIHGVGMVEAWCRRSRHDLELYKVPRMHMSRLF